MTDMRLSIDISIIKEMLTSNKYNITFLITKQTKTKVEFIVLASGKAGIISALNYSISNILNINTNKNGNFSIKLPKQIGQSIYSCQPETIFDDLCIRLANEIFSVVTNKINYNIIYV